MYVHSFRRLLLLPNQLSICKDTRHRPIYAYRPFRDVYRLDIATSRLYQWRIQMGGGGGAGLGQLGGLKLVSLSLSHVPPADSRSHLSAVRLSAAIYKCSAP